jgi:chemotaxis protein histidine kinase CheA
MSNVQTAGQESAASASLLRQPPARQPQLPAILPPDTPRQLLSKVIGKAEAKVVARGQATEAAERGRKLVAQARQNLSEAKAKGVEVRAGREWRMVEAALAQAHGSAPTDSAYAQDQALVATRTAENEAQDQLGAAEAALRVLEGSRASVEDEADQAQARVQLAADAVLWAEALPLLEKAMALQTELVETRVALRYLVHELQPIEATAREPSDPVVREIRDFLCFATELPGTYGSLAKTDWDSRRIGRVSMRSRSKAQLNRRRTEASA